MPAGSTGGGLPRPRPAGGGGAGGRDLGRGPPALTESERAAAVGQAGAESAENLNRAIAAAKPGEELMALVDTYLDDRHVAAPEHGLGCAIAAAGSEVPRQQAEVRRAAARRIKDIIGLVERQFPEWGQAAAHEKAMGIVASMVGALMLARA